MEEGLFLAEDGRDAVCGYGTFFEGKKEIEPELIFHKKDHLGIYQIQETLDITRSVKGQIAYNVGLLVVAGRTVARW